MRDREARLEAVVDVAVGVAGHDLVALDLACGTGSVTRRLLERAPAARSVAVDVDPVLLTIADATFAGDPRVQVVAADLRRDDWTRALPVEEFDAVLTSTALHWLPETAVERVYADLAPLVRPGGVVAHVEQMPIPDLPRLLGGLGRLDRAHRDARDADDAWTEWWAQAARDPALGDAFERRREVFATTYPTEEFSPPADWHIAALAAAGFSEVGVVWRSGAAAVVAAIR